MKALKESWDWHINALESMWEGSNILGRLMILPIVVIFTPILIVSYSLAELTIKITSK